MRKILISALLIFSLFTYIQATEAPQMSITDIKGVTHQITGTEQGLKIKGLEGKIVFLEFFGHKCPPCLKSIPHLIKLQEKHKDKLAIIAIEVQGYSNKQQVQLYKKMIFFTFVKHYLLLMILLLSLGIEYMKQNLKVWLRYTMVS